MRGIQQKRSFKIRKLQSATELLRLIHTNIARPFEVISLGGNNYFITFF